MGEEEAKDDGSLTGWVGQGWIAMDDPRLDHFIIRNRAGQRLKRHPTSKMLSVCTWDTSDHQEADKEIQSASQDQRP